MRSFIVARQFADCRAPEHHAGTPPVWALKLVLSRLASPGRSRQLALHDICVACFHASLEQPVWVQPLKELGLHDCLWLVEKEASKAFQTQVHRMFAEDDWSRSKPCRAWPAT